MKRLFTLLVLLVFAPLSFAYTSIADDPGTLLYLNFDNPTTPLSGADGEVPDATTITTGTTTDPLYQTGISGDSVDQGIYIGGTDVLNYSATNNFNASAGTIQFWVKPNWDGSDGLRHTFFVMSDSRSPADWTPSRISIQKESNSVLYVNMRSNKESNIDYTLPITGYDVSSWLAGEWHHIALTWKIPGQMAVYIDGINLGEREIDENTFLTVPTLMSVGSYYGDVGDGTPSGRTQSDSVIDELSVSNFSRSADDLAKDYFSSLKITGVMALTPFASTMFETWEQIPVLQLATSNVGIVDNIPASSAIMSSSIGFSSSNSTVANVDSSGKLIALDTGGAPGSVTDVQITASANGVSASTLISVRKPLLQLEHETIDPYLEKSPVNSVTTVPVVIIRFLPIIEKIAGSGDYYSDQSYNSEWGPGANPTDPADWNITLEVQKLKLDTFDKRVKFALEEGTKYHEYKAIRGDEEALHKSPFIGYKVVDYITVYEPTPPGKTTEDIGIGKIAEVDMNQILARINGSHYVNNLGVKEFWVWVSGINKNPDTGYNSAIHSDEVLRGMSESKMSSPTTPNQFNGWGEDLPVYNSTYTVYGQEQKFPENYALHNHGHQVEALLRYINKQQDGNNVLFDQRFSGHDLLGIKILGRAGDTHYPPNDISPQPGYVYESPALVDSDIENWDPNRPDTPYDQDGFGPTSEVDANTWTKIKFAWPIPATPRSTSDIAEGQWHIYRWQNMPGWDNTISYNNSTSRMSNWWQFTADWDAANRAGLGLYEPIDCSYTLRDSSDQVISRQALGGAGGEISVTVDTGSASDCRWIAMSKAPWITFNTDIDTNLLNTSANGNTVASFTIAPNTGGYRESTVLIAGKQFHVTQTEMCPFTIMPASLIVEIDEPVSFLGDTSSLNSCTYEWSEDVNGTVTSFSTAVTASHKWSGPPSVHTVVVNRVEAGQPISPLSFDIAVGPPHVNGFWPSAANAGEIVFLFGENFITASGAHPTVCFDTNCTIFNQILSDDLMLTIVPDGITIPTSIPLHVNTDVASGTSVTNWGTIASTISINGIWPAKASVGTIVFVFGSQFDPAPNGTQVTINGVPNFLTQGQDETLLLTIIPAGATSGPICVTAFGNTACGALNLEIVQ